MVLKDFRFVGYGLLTMPLFLGIVDFFSSRTTQYPYALSKYVELTNSEATRGLLLSLLFLVVALLVYSFLMRSWTGGEGQIRSFNPKVIYKVNNFFKYLCMIVIVGKILMILQMGILEFSLLARMGSISLGHAMYFVLLMFPFVLAYDLSIKGFSRTNILCLVGLLFLNLATGFRLLLISGLVIIVLFNWVLFLRINKAKIVIALGVFIALMVGYEVARGLFLESNKELSLLRSFLDSINRTSPINVIQLIEDMDVSPPLHGVLKLWTDPVFIVLESLGVDLGGAIDTLFNLHNISEPLFSNFLGWRGTPNYTAAGFSISLVPYAYLYGRELGIVVFAIFYGFGIAAGCKLVASDVYEWKLLGSALLVASFLCNESVAEATKSLVFFLIFIVMIFFIIIARQTFRFSLRVGHQIGRAQPRLKGKIPA